MDNSSGGSSGESIPWLQSITSPRRNLFSFGSGAMPSSPSEASISHRSTPPTRRRRIFNRLVRSGSDPRHGSSMPVVEAESPDFAPEAASKSPSKRKAAATPKSGKAPLPNILNSPTPLQVTNVEPPIILTEDLIPSTSPIVRLGSSLAMREIVDSSDDDLEELDLYANAAPNAANIAVNNIQNGLAAILNHRRRIAEERLAAEVKALNQGPRLQSAILVASDAFDQDGFLPGGIHEPWRYLPLCPAPSPADARSVAEVRSSISLTVLPSHCDFVQRSQQVTEASAAVWPIGQLPVELFDLITQHLARDDVKSMRLINREFEQKVSRSLFHTSVVPFNTEIYDMIDDERKTNNRSPPSVPKGKAKMMPLAANLPAGFPGVESSGLQWKNAKEDKEGKVYRGHGLRVFRGFGPHIKRFGMSFEISEKQLARPPGKTELDHIQSYYGSYDWPSGDYARFASLAGLENTADETSRMKAAFSNLEIVQELALSIDSGLGWLNGPDKSLRATIFDRATPVFGSSYPVPDHATQTANEFWEALQQSQAMFDPTANLKEMTLDYRPNTSHPSDIGGLRDNLYSNTQLWSTIDTAKITAALPVHPSRFGVLYSTSKQQTVEADKIFQLMPGNLTKEQREWLLETQWAQQAFLESYMLAVIDNAATFVNVTTLNIAKVSSRYLPMLAREGFWNGLPQLAEVILRVSPDWRTVDKDEAGAAQTTSMFPSDALRPFFHDILQTQIAPRESIKRLTVGWVGGGEHAEGMFARNNNLFPAPVMRLEHCTANTTLFGITLDHVEHLTLSNCWITPPALEGVVQMHSTKALKKLTLDSVSLTAHPAIATNAHGMPAPQFAQAMAAIQAHIVTQQALVHGQPANGAAQLAGFLQNMNAQQIVAAQQQWHAGMAQLQAQANPNVPPAFPLGLPPAAIAPANPIPNNPIQPTPPPGHWASNHREGSWPQLINHISPGPIFTDYLPAPLPWDDPLPPRRSTNLKTIEFHSCGYAKLPHNTAFDQLVLEPPGTAPAAHPRHLHSHWFRTRHSCLKAAMMATTDRNVGQIVQYMPERELHALQFAWGLTEGWSGEAQESGKVEEAEFDGFLPGGTGRFSGVVRYGMELVGVESGNGNHGLSASAPTSVPAAAGGLGQTMDADD